MRNILFYILIFLAFGCSHKYGIQQPYAFTRIMTAGNIQVDEQNRPLEKGIRKIYLLYLETIDTVRPKWDTAWINANAYSIEPLKLMQDQLTIGKSKNGQETMTINSTIGNNLWQLMLTPLPQSVQNEAIKNKSSANAVVLTGSWKGKRVIYGIKEIKELETIYGE